MECKNCRKETGQIKAGKLGQEVKNTNVNTVEKYTRQIQREGPIVKKKLYMEGNSGRAVGRILGISKNICLTG